MKGRLFVAFVIFAITALVLTWGASAHDEVSRSALQYSLSIHPSSWRQVVDSGFGDTDNRAITSLAQYGDYLYAGTFNNNGSGAQLRRSNDGSSWNSVSNNGLGNTNNSTIGHLLEFDSMFYAGVYNEVDGGGVYRSSTGTAWSQVTIPGFNPTNAEIIRLASFNGHIYAGTRSITDTHGAEIWRSSTGDSGDWTQVVTNGFDGNVDNSIVVELTVYNGYLYAGTDNWNGTEVWRSDNGTTWNHVNASGFGDTYNWSVAFETFDGFLYVGTYNFANSDNPGCELWRCVDCDGSDWEHIIGAKGFGDTFNRSIRAFESFDGALYAVTYNRNTGTEVWQTEDGENWVQVNVDGFGDSDNTNGGSYDFITNFKMNLYVGTWNSGGKGCEIWQSFHPIFLPLITRNIP